MSVENTPEKVMLRDGSQVAIQPLKADRAQALLEFFRLLPEGDRLNLRDDVTKPEWLDRFVRRVEGSEVIEIVAESAGEIVGEATLYRWLHGWMMHLGEVRVTVAPAPRRKGMGHALAREIVRQATGMGVEKLIVQITEDQVAARRLFDHLGFLQEAVLRNHVKDIRGHKRDLLIMANDVSHIWHAMEAMLADYSPTME
jgi:L-amino acid N-acyltransferase YncA